MFTNTHHTMCEEAIQVELWNIHNFERLGFDRLESIDALSNHIDWHDVENLMNKGCPKDTATKIAAPLHY